MERGAGNGWCNNHFQPFYTKSVLTNRSRFCLSGNGEIRVTSRDRFRQGAEKSTWQLYDHGSSRSFEATGAQGKRESESFVRQDPSTSSVRISLPIDPEPNPWKQCPRCGVVYLRDRGHRPGVCELVFRTGPLPPEDVEELPRWLRTLGILLTQHHHLLHRRSSRLEQNNRSRWVASP